MAEYASHVKLDQVTLVGDPPPSADAPGAPLPAEPAAAPARAAPPPPADIAESAAADPFLAAAIREFDAGHVEQPLWVRAIGQTSGNVALARTAYLRARAASLRVEKRGKRAARLTRRADAPQFAEDSDTLARAPAGRVRPAKGAPGTLDRKRVAIAAGGLAAIAAIAAFVLLQPGSAPPPAAPAQAVPSPGATAAAKAEAAKKAESGGAGAAMSNEDFARKIQEFKDARNWNVLVLYAVEWARKQPASPDAWKELGAGYLKMRQYDDALEATRKAAQLSPSDFQLWQDLGHINVALRQPAAALAAFEKATELNPRDVTSFVQAGAIAAELNRLPQAKAAFAAALEISPGDVDALCGSAAIARKESRTKDADAYVRQVKAGGQECRDAEAAAPAAAPTAPAAKKAAPARGR
jgi:tetratricopeptide (TPR) repeat protein